MRTRRLVAAVGLALLAIVEIVPHRHGDASLDLVADIITGATQVQVINCSDPNSKGGHLHRDSAREVDPCIACLRQHVQIARSLTGQVAAPLVAYRPLTPAIVAPFRAAHRTTSSRAPPALFS